MFGYCVCVEFSEVSGQSAVGPPADFDLGSLDDAAPAVKSILIGLAFVYPAIRVDQANVAVGLSIVVLTDEQAVFALEFAVMVDMSYRRIRRLRQETISEQKNIIK